MLTTLGHIASFCFHLPQIAARESLTLIRRLNRRFPLALLSSSTSPPLAIICPLQASRCFNKEIYSSLLAGAPTSPLLVYFAPRCSEGFCVSRATILRTSYSTPKHCERVHTTSVYLFKITVKSEPAESFCTEVPVPAPALGLTSVLP
jgi:hypothetical protein